MFCLLANTMCDPRPSGANFIYSDKLLDRFLVLHRYHAYLSAGDGGHTASNARDALLRGGGSDGVSGIGQLLITDVKDDCVEV